MSLVSMFHLLQSWGLDFKQASVLDVFGGTGELSSYEYIPLVAQVEAWEIQPEKSLRMKTLFPQVKTSICDAFEQIKESGQRFDIVIVDTGGHPNEAFGLFPHLFDRLKDNSALIINILTDVANPKYQICWADRDLTERAQFYHTSNPYNIPVEEMLTCYVKRAHEAALIVEHGAVQHRYQNVYRLVLKLRRWGCPAKDS